MADYNATKFGVRGIWKGIRRDVRVVGVRTNIIAPTFLADTMMLDKVTTALRDLGVTLATLESAVDAIIRVACTENVDGMVYTRYRLCKVGKPKTLLAVVNANPMQSRTSDRYRWTKQL